MPVCNLLGYCGLYCGACPHYRGSLSDGAHLLAEAERQGKDPGAFSCHGCRSGKLYTHAGCRECKIRACAAESGLPHCGTCPELPCQIMRDFIADGHAHHLDVLFRLAELRQDGPERWLSAQQKRWSCECGREYSWYEKTCRNCGAVLQSFGP